MGCSAGTQGKNEKIYAEENAENKIKKENNKRTYNQIILETKLSTKKDISHQKNSGKSTPANKRNIETDFYSSIKALLDNFNEKSNTNILKICKLSVYKFKHSLEDEQSTLNLFKEKKYFLIKDTDKNTSGESETSDNFTRLNEEISTIAKRFKKNIITDKSLKLFEKLSFQFKLICINENREITLKLNVGKNKNILLLFFDIINNNALMKIKEINQSLKAKNTSLNYEFYPIMNYFFKEEDFSFQKDFIHRVGFENINVYIPLKDNTLIDTFGLDNLITSRVFLIDDNGYVKLIGEADNITDDEINFYLNVDFINLSRNKDNHLLGRYNLYDEPTFKSIKEHLNNKANDIKKLQATNKVNSVEIILIKAHIINSEGALSFYFPMKVNIDYYSSNTNLSIKFKDYLSREMKNYILNEKINLSEEDTLREAINIISYQLVQKFSLSDEREYTINKRTLKRYSNNMKALYSKSCNLVFNLKLFDKAIADISEEIQNFLADLIYTNPNISKIGLRYTLYPAEGLQYNKILKGYKEGESNRDLVLISKSLFANNKFFLIFNSNIQYLEENVKQSLAEYIKFLISNRKKFDIDIIFVILGLNSQEKSKIRKIFELEKEIVYFWFLTSSSLAEFNIYDEDFSIFALVLDRELKLQFFEEIQKMRKECFNNNLFTNNKNIYKHLFYFSKKIEYDTFKKIQLQYDRLCSNINEKCEDLHNLIPCCNFFYDKILTYNGNKEKKFPFYKNLYFDIKLPDHFQDLMSEALDEFVNEIERMDEEYGIYVGKSLIVYETFQLPIKKIKKCNLCKANLQIKLIFYCKVCEETYCENCEGKINKIMNVNADETTKLESKIHDHNLILISLRDEIDNRKLFIYTFLFESHMQSNTNLKCYKKCCLCENYIYPENKLVFLNLTELNNANVANMEQFICNDDCFNQLISEEGTKNEEFIKNVNKNKINTKNLLFLKIYQKIDY